MNESFDPCTVISARGQRKNLKFQQNGRLFASDNLRREEKYFAMQDYALQAID
jgi:hypothetical protein